VVVVAPQKQVLAEQQELVLVETITIEVDSGETLILITAQVMAVVRLGLLETEVTAAIHFLMELRGQ
jgi:hypothetical protein